MPNLIARRALPTKNRTEVELDKYEKLLCDEINSRLDTIIKERLKEINGGIMPSAVMQNEHMTVRKYSHAKVPTTQVLWKDKKFLEHTMGTVRLAGGTRPALEVTVHYDFYEA